MIAVDTSALMAIALNEKEADACIAALEAEDNILISAGTMAEALIVAARRNVGEEIASLIDGLGFDIVAVTPASARQIALAYAHWERVSARRLSISAIASPTPWRRKTPAACCMSATISRRRISPAFSKGEAAFST